MLTQIRDRATGWIAWIIVFIISIPFALWGINEYFSGGATLNVAVVNGKEIDQQAYRYALEERRSAARRMMGSRFDAEVLNSIEFKTSVLDDLIRRELLNQDAQSAGFSVGDEQLAEFIRTTPQFQRDGRFDSAAYQQAVQSLGYTKVGFESYLRRQNVLQQIQNGLSRSAFITKRDESQLLGLAEEQRVFDYVSVRPESFMPDIEVSEDEIVAHYEENPDAYTSPEMIKVDYVRLSVADLAEEVEVTEEDVRRYYEANKDRYRIPAQREASHILLTVNEDADEATRQEVLDKAKSLAERARAGEDFAELARQHSQDPGSSAKGGDLGLIQPGVMVKPFEDALLAMQEGEVSDPVKTRFGYHVIKVTKLIPEKGKELSEVREEIESEERRRLAEGLFLDRAETFRNLVFEHPESLQPAAEELGLQVQTSDWFSQDAGEGIAQQARVREIAFSDDVFIDDLNSEAIELDVNTLIAVRKKDTKPETIRPLDQVRDQIEQVLKTEKAREKAVEEGEALLAEVRDGAAWDAVISAAGLQATQVEQTRMQPDARPSAQVNAEVFRAPPPEAGPVFGGVATADGGYVVFRVTAARSAQGAETADQTRQKLNAALARRRGAEYFLSYERGLRETADVEIFEENL